MIKLFFCCSVLIAIHTLYACKKDSPVICEPQNDIDTCFCEPLPKPDIVVGDPSLYSDFDENFVSFLEINPNNENEIVFSHGTSHNEKLKYYNTATNEHRVLFNEPIVGRISWSSKDWILFQRTSNLGLYKIKSNGDSLTQLTYGNTYHAGTWNKDGDRFMVYNQYKSEYATEIMDENGMVVDSIGFWVHLDGNWSHPQYYLGDHYREIMIMDVDTKTIVKKIDFNVGSEINTLGWVDDNRFLFTNNGRLYDYNIVTQASNLLNCECYRWLSALGNSSGYSKITAIETIASPLPNYITHFETKILVINEDGEEMEEIIPW